MGTLPKFLVNLVAGRIIVISSDGTELEASHADWLRKLISKELRSINFRNSNAPVPEGYVLNRHGTEHEIDPVLVKLNKYRQKEGILVTDWANAAMISRPSLSDYLSGRSRPTMEAVRALAYVLGFNLTAELIKKEVPPE